MKKDKSHKNKTGYTTPKDYLSSFGDDLFDKLNLNTSHNLADKNQTGFKTPKDYFDKFEEDLFTNLSIEKNTILKDQETGFTTPNGYIENLEDRILKEVIPTKETRVIRMFSKKQFMKVASIAAVFILSFFIMKPVIFSNKDESLTFDDIEYGAFEEYINEEDLSLSEFEIADLYNASEEDIDNISTENTIDNNQLYEYLSDEYTTDDYIDSL